MAHKLLLADDSVTIQRVIELTFADEDVEVTTVGDGQLAIDRLDADPPDIILADVDMPKRDGYDVAAYVKSRPKLAHIPVVLLTGAFEPIDQARATAAGSSDVLAKPFEPQMVINRVRELLGKKRPDEDGADAASPLQEAQPQMGNPQPAGEGTQQPVSLDDYFDQLDAAFSNLQSGAPPPDGPDEMDWPGSTPPSTAAAVDDQPPAEAEKPVPPAPVAGVPTFWADSAATAGNPDAPVAAHPPAAPTEPVSGAAAAPRAPFAPMPTFAADAAASVGKPVAPAIAADAPSAVAPGASADEPEGGPHAPVAPSAPVMTKPAANPFANLTAAKAEAAARPAAPVISDDVIEEIVSRVLQRMSDRVVRETVADIVSQTAERLVQEEIDRIKTAGGVD